MTISLTDRRPARQYSWLVIAVSVITFLLSATPAVTQTTVFGSFEYERFNRDLDPWKLALIELSGKSEKGTLIGRVEQARRFGEKGTLFEVDAYPQFSKTTYAFVNFGTSSSSILPHRRYSAELFHTFPSAWEASAGAQRLDFNGSSTVYTGSLGKYQGNYWVSVRPSLIERERDRFSAVSLTARRYFATADDYIGADAHGGQTPSDPLVARELGLTRWSGGIQAQHLAGNILLRGRIGLESISLGPGASRRGTIVTAGIGRRF